MMVCIDETRSWDILGILSNVSEYYMNNKIALVDLGYMWSPNESSIVSCVVLSNISSANLLFAALIAKEINGLAFLIERFATQGQ